MFYRRKIILALLELFNSELEKIRLQKLLFLFTQRQQKSEYDFVPYKFGCYSYSAVADLSTMVTKGLLSDNEKSFVKKDSISYLKQLKGIDSQLLLDIKKLYGTMDSNALMKHTYINYPFFAINSETAPRILSEIQYEVVKRSKPSSTSTVLYTIGYEGISLEEYLNRLIKNDIKLLVDVRSNALSMKYGFSKSLLKRFCDNLGIQYLHIPEVGIQSDQRQELNTQSDYDKLFNQYRQNNLSKTVDAQTKILNLLKQNKRIALTCFEANIDQCHRKHLAEAITALPGFEYELKHI